MNFFWVYSLFFLSGATGLIYEVLWFKLLKLQFGSLTSTAAFLFAVFLLGLALGASYTDRWLRREKKEQRYLLWYALAELGIGLYALFTLLLIPWVGKLHLLYNHGITAPWMATLDLGLFAIVLLPPTVLMGFTFPLLCELVEPTKSDHAQQGKRAALIYSLNVAGGAFGCMLAGFYLIANYGLHGSLIFSAVVNLLLAVAALFFHQRGYGRRSTAANDAANNVEQKISAAVSETALHKSGITALAFFSGVIFLALEIVGTRYLQLVFGSSTYTFSTILFCALVGIALGSLLFASLASKLSDVRALLLSCALLALVVGFIPMMLKINPYLFLNFFPWLSNSFLNDTLGKILITLVSFLPPFVVSGFMFSALLKFAAQHSLHSGKNQLWAENAGYIYKWNTFGSVSICLIMPLWILPNLGSTTILNLIYYLSLGFLPLAFWTVRFHYPKRESVLLVVFACTSLGFLVSDRLNDFGNPKLLHGGVFFQAARYRAQYIAGLLDRQLAKKEWIYFKEGKDATVLVEQEGEHRALSINGKVVATSNEGDTSNQYLLSLIPYLLHGGFEQSAVIGLGTGMTAGVAAELSKKLDIVDINVDVLGAATTFAKNNFDLMNRVGKPSPVDGKTAVQIFIEDGRHFMRATPKKYDLITSDPIDPFTQGSTNLYSLEYFQLCRQHLKPGGYFTHWLPLYQMGTKEFWEIIKTFSTVFPNGTIWLTHSDSILVASVDESGATAPTRIDWRLAKQRFEKKPSQQMFQAIHINNLEHALSLYMGDTERMSLAVAPIPVVTDDNLLMELSLPKYLYAETIFPNIDFLLEQKARNGSSFKSLLLDQSTYQDNKSSQIDFTFEPLLSKVIRFHGQPINSETIAEFKKLDAQVKQYPTLRRRLLASLRDKSETAYMLQGATLGWQLLKSYPTQDLEIILIEMNWLLVENRSDELLKKTRQAIAIDPQHYFVNFVMGKLAMRQRQFPQSIDYFEIALKNDPLREIQPEALNNLAACYYQMKNIPAAIEYLRSSLKIQPNQPEIESLLRVIR